MSTRKKIDDLIIKRVFKCSKRTLFDAWSRPELMSRWFFAASAKVKDSLIENEFRVGGPWSVTMYFEGGDEAKLNGQYLEIHRYYKIIFSWNSSISQDGRVELLIKELSPNRSELTLTHSNFVSEENRQMHNHGWEACLANLEIFAKEPSGI